MPPRICALSLDNSFTQGVERADRELLDAQALVGHLVPAGGMFAFLADHRQDLFPDGEFEDLFPSGKGRPSIPASVMASILVLQTLHDLSDRETAEAARCDLRWKVSTGMALDHKGFDPSTLVYWRKRLAKSDRPHRINEAVRQVVLESGILRGRGKRAVDSTILAGGSAAITAVCTAHDYSLAGKPLIDWDEPGAKDALVSALVNDANALLGALGEGDLDEAGEPVVAALAMLALVAGQDVEPADGSDGTDGRWRIARRDGYRAHVAAEPGTGIITGEELTKAAGPQNSDAAVAEQFLAADIIDTADSDDAAGGKDTDDSDHSDHSDAAGTREWYGDSAYGAGDLRKAIDDAGGAAVIKPKPLVSPVEGGFTIDGFTVDEQAGTVGCPAGHTRPISATRVASFGALCRDCPLRQQCTKSKSGRKIVLHERDRELRKARSDWTTDPELRDRYRKFRPNVERVISQIASRGGRRLNLRYRGTVKNHAWLTRRSAGLNLRNLIGRGLTHTAGVWAAVWLCRLR